MECHHLVPREFGGERGPTAELCGACHGNLHSQVRNLTGKGKRRWFFAGEALDRAQPFLNIILAAQISWEEQHSLTKRKIIISVEEKLLQQLHLLKRDKGYTSLERFLVDLFKKIVSNP